MDEMTIDRELRDFRADAPATEPSADVCRRAFAADPTGGARPSRRTWWAVAASAAAVVGVVVAVGVLHTGSETEPSGPGVLDGAASQVAAQPDPPKPRDDQWVYVEGTSSQLGGRAGPTRPSWVRFDGLKEAFPDYDSPSGPLHIQDLMGDHSPEAWWEEAADLPEDPQALLAQLRSSRLVEEEGSTRAERDYDGVVDVLTFGTLLPPSGRARLLQALGTIPGVRFDRAAAPDLVGRPVLSVTFVFNPNPDPDPRIVHFRSKRELLLDPQTYAVRGTRDTALEDAPGIPKTGPVSKGEVWTADTIVSVGVVDAPGYLP